jgi:hypothetical protein
VENLRLLEAGEVDIGWAVNGVAVDAFEGTGEFEGEAMDDLMVIGNIYAEVMQVVARADTGIETIDDMAGHRVAIGPPGSGTEVLARQLLELLHPTLDPDGLWSVELPALPPGSYRAFADFRPTGAEGLTLGVDLTVAGRHGHVPRRPEILDGDARHQAGDRQAILQRIELSFREAALGTRRTVRSGGSRSACGAPPGHPALHAPDPGVAGARAASAQVLEDPEERGFARLLVLGLGCLVGHSELPSTLVLCSPPDSWPIRQQKTPGLHPFRRN